MAGPDTSTTAARPSRTDRGLPPLGPTPVDAISGADPKIPRGGITDVDRALAPARTATVATATVAAARDWQPVYTPGIAHNHQPSGKWSEIQARPVTVDLGVDQICRHFEPPTVATKIATTYLRSRPLALVHFEHYLKGGGADFVEDGHLERMVRVDAGVRRLLQVTLPKQGAPSGQTLKGSVEVRQRNYEVEDHQFAFGAIDRLDFEVDPAAGWVRLWFQDRYEWHPVYEGIYERLPGDVIRDNNCLHAAMVEMKRHGAADFWMKGKAVVSLSEIQAAAEQPAPRKRY
jgi:hypothetical protein